ncbi:MAG: hypothetical protein AAB532_03515 [Patescibacteria group bacterium]
MLHISFLFAKNRVRLIVLSLLFLILIIIGIIFYLDYSKDNLINQSSGLKGYTQLQVRIKSLASDKEIASSNYYLRAFEKINNLSSNKLSNKEKYESLVQARIFLSSLYSDTNKKSLYQIHKDLRGFAQNNFASYSNGKNDFPITCMDSSCADSPQPTEIINIVNDIKTSSISSRLKNDLIIHLQNVGYLPKTNTKLKATAYLIMLDVMKDYYGITKSGSNPIVNEYITFLGKYYPEEYKKSLELSGVKSKVEALKQQEETDTQSK